MTRTIGIYVRVSSKTQDEASQLPDLKRWAAAQDAEIIWYRDKFTGKSMDRKDWNRLEADYKGGRLTDIAVWRLDRLGRTAKGLNALFDDLTTRKINLVSLKDGLDLQTPAGRLMANVLASVAQYETEVRAERQLAGIAAAKAAGKHLGRPIGISTPIKVTPEQTEQVKRLKADGTKVAAIARATGLSRPTVYKILSA